MKMNHLALLTMGRSLIRLKDRTGAYKLPTGKPFPEFGANGRRKAVLTSAVRAPVPAAQANLFEAPKAPAVAAPAGTVALAQSAPLPSGPPKSSAAPVPSAPSYWSRAASAGGRLWSRFPGKFSWPAWMVRVPRVFQFGSPSAAHVSHPQAQTELALEQVTVLRNDLSEADLTVVKVQPKKENVEASGATGGPASINTWTRATARWIKLKNTAPQSEAGSAPERPAPMAELKP